MQFVFSPPQTAHPPVYLAREVEIQTEASKINSSGERILKFCVFLDVLFMGSVCPIFMNTLLYLFLLSSVFPFQCLFRFFFLPFMFLFSLFCIFLVLDCADGFSLSSLLSFFFFFSFFLFPPSPVFLVFSFLLLLLLSPCFLCVCCFQPFFFSSLGHVNSPTAQIWT